MSDPNTCPHCSGTLYACYCPTLLLAEQHAAAVRASNRRTSTRSMLSARTAVARLKEF